MQQCNSEVGGYYSVLILVNRREGPEVNLVFVLFWYWFQSDIKCDIKCKPPYIIVPSSLLF